jgi:hypothetical protein
MATATRKPKRRKPAKRAAKPAQRALDSGLTEAPPVEKLTESQQIAVVQRLAMYDTPQQIADWVKEEFSIELSRQAIQHYDPTRGDRPAEKWCAIFEATRKAFLETTADIPIANKSVRLRRLERMALAAEKTRNFALAASLHELAAKEVGEVFTNRHKMEHTGKDGEPIEVRTDELRSKLARRITGVASRIGTHSNNSGAHPSGARSA